MIINTMGSSEGFDTKYWAESHKYRERSCWSFIKVSRVHWFPTLSRQAIFLSNIILPRIWQSSVQWLLFGWIACRFAALTCGRKIIASQNFMVQWQERWKQWIKSSLFYWRECSFWWDAHTGKTCLKKKSRLTANPIAVIMQAKGHADTGSRNEGKTVSSYCVPAYLRMVPSTATA